MLQQQAEYPLLDEPEKDDQLEAQQLRQTSLHLHHGLRALDEVEDGENASADTEGFDDLYPYMRILWAERIQAVVASDFSRFLDCHCENFDDRILEHEDPAHFGPIELRTCFVGCANRVECCLVECAIR